LSVWFKFCRKVIRGTRTPKKKMTGRKKKEDRETSRYERTINTTSSENVRRGEGGNLKRRKKIWGRDSVCL